jgi:hypothetical protein
VTTTETAATLSSSIDWEVIVGGAIDCKSIVCGAIKPPLFFNSISASFSLSLFSPFSTRLQHNVTAIEWEVIISGAIDCTLIVGGAIIGGAIDWEVIDSGAINCKSIVSGAIIGGVIDWEVIDCELIGCDSIVGGAIVGGAIDWEAIDGGAINCESIVGWAIINGVINWEAIDCKSMSVSQYLVVLLKKTTIN